MSVSAAVESGKRLVAGTFLDRCVLLDATNVPDDSGGSHTELVPRAIDVACRFGQLMETDIRLIAGQAYGPATGTLMLPLEVKANEGTYVQSVADDTSFWLVVGDRTPDSNMSVARRLLIREATWAA